MTERFQPPHSDPNAERTSEYDPDELTASALEQLLRHKEKITYLLSRLKEGIEEGRWQAILADDRSARLLGRVVHEVMRQHAREGEDAVAPKLFFAAGDREIWGRRNEDMRAYAKHLAEIQPGRFLVLTNYTESGNTLLRMGGSLREAKVPYDIATLGDNQQHLGKNPTERLEVVDQLEKDGGAERVYSATRVMRSTLGTKEKPDILHHDYDPELVATGGVDKRYFHNSAVSARDERVPQQSVNDMRKAVKMMAEDIYEELFGDEKGDSDEA